MRHKLTVGKKVAPQNSEVFSLLKGQKFLIQDQTSKKIEEIHLSRDYHLNYHALNGKTPPWVRLLTRAMSNSNLGVHHAIQTKQDLQRALLGLIKTSQEMEAQARRLNYGDVLQMTMEEMAKSEKGKGPFTELLKNYEKVSVSRARLTGTSDPAYLTGNFFNGAGRDFRNYGEFNSRSVHFGTLETNSTGERFLTMYAPHWAQGAYDADGDMVMLLEFMRKHQNGPDPSMPYDHYAIPIKYPGTKRMGGLSIMPNPTDVLGSLKHINNQISHNLPQFHTTGIGTPATLDDYLAGDNFTRATFERVLLEKQQKEALGKDLRLRGITPANELQFANLAMKYDPFTMGTKNVGMVTNKVIYQEIEEALKNGMTGDPNDYQAFLMETAGIGDKRINILEGVLKANNKTAQSVNNFDRSLQDTFKIFFGKIRGLNRGGLAPLEFLSLMSKAAGEAGITNFESMSPSDLETLVNLHVNPFGYALQEASSKGMKKNAHWTPKDMVTGSSPINNRIPRAAMKESIYDLARNSGYLDVRTVALDDHLIPDKVKGLSNPIVALLNPTLAREGVRKTSSGATATNRGTIETFLIGNSILVETEKGAGGEVTGYSPTLIDAEETLRRYVDNTFDPEFNITVGPGKSMGGNRLFTATGAFSPKNLTNRNWANTLAQEMISSNLDQFYVTLPKNATLSQRKVAMANYIVSAGRKMLQDPDTITQYQGLIVHAQLVGTIESNDKFRELGKVLQHAETTVGRASAVNISNGTATLGNPLIAAQELAQVSVVVPEKSNNNSRLNNALAWLETAGVEIDGKVLHTISAAKAGSSNWDVVQTMFDLEGGLVPHKRLIKNVSQMRYAYGVSNTTFAYPDVDIMESTMISKNMSRDEVMALLKSKEELLGTADPTLKNTYQGMSEAWISKEYTNDVLTQLRNQSIGLDRQRVSDVPLPGYIKTSTLSPSGRRVDKWVAPFRAERVGKLIGEGFEKIETIREFDYGMTSSGKRIDVIVPIGELSSKGITGLDPIANLYQTHVGKGNAEVGLLRTQRYYEEIAELNLKAQRTGMQQPEYQAERLRLAKEYLGEVGITREYVTVGSGSERSEGWHWIKTDTAQFVQNSSEMQIASDNLTSSPSNIFSPAHEDEMLQQVKNLIELNGGALSDDEMRLFRTTFLDSKRRAMQAEMPVEHLALIGELHGALMKRTSGSPIQNATRMKQQGLMAAHILTPDRMLNLTMDAHLKGLKINPITVGATVGVGLGAAFIAKKRKDRQRDSSNW